MRAASGKEDNSSSPTGPRKILVAIDGSENAERAAQAAIELGKKCRSSLIVLSVVPHPGTLASPPRDYYDYYESIIQRWVDKVVQDCERQGVAARGQIMRAQPSIPGEILEVAKAEGADLVIVGSRGLSMLKGGFRQVLAGSVSNAVVSHAPCNVLVVK